MPDPLFSADQPRFDFCGNEPGSPGWHFSRFSPHQVTMRGPGGEFRPFATTEHYFQAMKFPDDRLWFDYIAAAPTPEAAKRRGVSAGCGERTLRADWQVAKDEVMYEAVKAKVAQNADVATALEATGERELRATAPHDTYWGTGGARKDGTRHGRNQLGRTLMRVRAEMRAATRAQADAELEAARLAARARAAMAAFLSAG
jgi:ribA/ribD-fused uncharacterized protein